MAMTVANKVTKHVMKAIAGLHCRKKPSAFPLVRLQNAQQRVPQTHHKGKSECRAGGVVHAKVEEETSHSCYDQECRQRKALRRTRNLL